MRESEMSLNLKLEIAGRMREIAHMEADMEYHRAQLHTFGQAIKQKQQELDELRCSTLSKHITSK